MNFNTKETYHTARTVWKAEYNQLSADIRDARRSFNKSQQEFAKSVNKAEPTWAAAEKAEKVEKDRATRSDLRARANDLLSALSSAKKEAFRQWQAAHPSAQTKALIVSE